MSEQLRESLSAAMDGEAGEFELKRVLNELSTNEDLRGSWERYHLVRGLLRRELGNGTPTDLPERLWARIDADESFEQGDDGLTDNRARPRGLGPITGVAVAAGVALTVVLGVNLFPSARDDAYVADRATPIETETTPVAVEVISPLNAYPSRLDMKRTQAYMLHHAQHTALNEQGSALPFAKVAAFETR